MLAAKMLENEGIDVEVIDVRTINPLDEETIGESVCKTERVVLVAEACRAYGPANERAMVAIEKAFDYLHAPPVRVAGRDSPVPFDDSLEKGVWPESEGVLQAIC